MKLIRRIPCLLISSFLWISSSGQAQQVWSLQACIDQALTQNLQLRELYYAGLVKAEGERQSIRAMLPSIEASSNYVIQYGRSIDPNTNEILRSDFFSNNYSINSELDIFQGFQKQHQHSASKFMQQAAKAENEQEKYMLAFRVMTAYYDLLFYTHAADNATAQIEISKTNRAYVQKQIDIGLKAASDIHLAESILIEDELQLIRLDNDRQAAELRLVQEMNLKNEENSLILEEVDPLTIISTQYSVDSLYRRAVSFLPILRSQELKLESARSRVKQARGMLSPLVTAFAGYGTGFYETNVNTDQELIPFKEQVRDNASQYVGISMSILISDRWTKRSQVNQQKIAFMKMSNAVDIQKQDIRKTIQELVGQYKATEREYLKSLENEAVQKITFEVAQKKYEKGLFSALDLYRSKTLSTAAQNSRLQLAMKLTVLQKTLDFYAGRSVFNITTSNS